MDSDYDYVSFVDDELKCSICIAPFEDPLVASCCKNTFCRKCCSNLKTCPICRSKHMVMSESQRLVLNLLAKLEVRCLSCSAVVKRYDFEDHRLKFCPISCPDGCGETLTKMKLEDHKKECSHVVVTCPSSIIGCLFLDQRLKLNEHLKDCKYQSQHELYLKYIALENENKMLKKETEKFKGDIEKLQNELGKFKTKPEMNFSFGLEHPSGGNSNAFTGERAFNFNNFSFNTNSTGGNSNTSTSFGQPNPNNAASGESIYPPQGSTFDRFFGNSIHPSLNASNGGNFNTSYGGNNNFSFNTNPSTGENSNTSTSFGHSYPNNQEENLHVNIKTVTENGIEIYFKIRQTTALGKLMNAYCDRNYITKEKVLFFYGDRLVKPTETPKDLGLIDKTTYTLNVIENS